MRVFVASFIFFLLLLQPCFQSDYPTDTLLPNMSLGIDPKTRVEHTCNDLQCGSNSYCSTAGLCHCIEGFDRNPEPSRGCVRRNALNCPDDQFLRLENMKMPENEGLIHSSEFFDACKDFCRQDCECTAITFVEPEMTEYTAPECWYWNGELYGMREYTASGQDIFVKVAPTNPEKKKKKPKTVLIACLGAGLGFIFIFCAMCCYWRIKKKQARARAAATSIGGGPNETEVMISQIAGEERFTMMDLETIVQATENFSRSNILGQGGFGVVYKAILPDGTEAAVKRLSTKSSQGIEEFKNEVRTILNVLHKNLVRLQGCCCEGMERILVYEFLENASLNRYLFDEVRSRLLNWETRFRIIGEIAQGLSYLHNSRDSPIIHRDLKPSNILLDRNMTSKISDFGMAKILESGTTEALTQRVAGTYGYMSEEYAMSNTMSKKSDVFSFGVMILEIITGKQNAKFCVSNPGDSLLHFVWRRWIEGDGLELVDANFIDDSLVEEDVLRCTQIGLCCVQDNPDNRPGSEVLAMMIQNRTTDIPLPREPDYYYARYLASLAAPSSSAGQEPESSTAPTHSASLNRITLTAMGPR